MHEGESRAIKNKINDRRSLNQHRMISTTAGVGEAYSPGT